MAKILIIDDDPDIVDSVRMTLESAGHMVVEAGSGKEGLSTIEAEHPDLIILDVMMETETAGFQLAKELRSTDPASKYAAYKDIPILMLTAVYSTTPLGIGQDIDTLPVELFVDKPIDPEDLVRRVDWALSQES